jgi:hypothetical protein
MHVVRITRTINDHIGAALPYVGFWQKSVASAADH